MIMQQPPIRTPGERRIHELRSLTATIRGIRDARRRLPRYSYSQVCALQRRAATLFARHADNPDYRKPLKRLAAMVDKWLEPYHRQAGVKRAFFTYHEIYHDCEDRDKVARWFAHLEQARDRAEAAEDWEAYVNYDNLVELIRDKIMWQNELAGKIEAWQAEAELFALMAELDELAGLDRAA